MVVRGINLGWPTVCVCFLFLFSLTVSNPPVGGSIT